MNKVAKHTQTIRRQFADEFSSVFDHFVGLALKGLILYEFMQVIRTHG